MKANIFVAIALALMVVVMLPAQTYSPTAIQQTATVPNAATKVANANAAVANQVTATLTPAASNYVYITSIDMEVCQDATGLAQTNVSWNFTGGITPSGNIPIWAYSTALAIDVCVYKEISFPTPLKSITPGTAVTLQSPASDAHAAYTANVFWYEAQ